MSLALARRLVGVLACVLLLDAGLVASAAGAAVAEPAASVAKAELVAGAAAPPAAIASATSLKIVPSGSTKLSEHVGHQVEVTGSVSDKSSSPSAAPSDPAASRPSSASSPTIEARSVRMVSATCTPQ